MKPTIEQVVDRARFSMPALFEAVWPLLAGHPAVAPCLPQLNAMLGPGLNKVGCAILRHVFLIELVKVPKIETTKVRVRWFRQLEGDQRFCSFEECLEIACGLLGELANGWLDEPAHAELLRLCLEHSILPYEVPLDYATRPAHGDNETRIHRRGNVVWLCTDTMLRTVKLRQYLTSAGRSPDVTFFRKVLEDKVKVKTYLTDRALTGEHKTNREKRWEVHPHSVQFAERRQCMAIEHVLMTQLCAFDEFPADFRRTLQEGNILPASLDTFRCPITLDPMSFPAFKEEVMNPVHGKSGFQIGHLNPLKLDAHGEAASGHTADNVSWVSADGNRIQGSMDLRDVRVLLRRIAANYDSLGVA